MNLQGKKILLTGDSHMDWSRFGNSLEKRLKEEGATVTRLAIGGSNLRQWTKDKEVCRVLLDFAPTGKKSWKGRGSERNKYCIAWDDIAAKGPYDLVIVSSMGNDIAEAYLKYPRYYKDYTPEIYVERVKEVVRRSGAPNFLLVGGQRTEGTAPGSIDPSDKSAAFRGQPYVNAATAAFGDSFYNARAISESAWATPTKMKKGEGDNVHYMGETAVKWAQDVVDWAKNHDLRVRFGKPDVPEDTEPSATGSGGMPWYAPVLVVVAIGVGVAYFRRR